jgi:hypothetical protein
MLTITQQREQAAAAARVMDYLRRHYLGPEDLVRLGGEDLSDPDVCVRDRARAVERAWALLAKLDLKFQDFVAAVAPQEDGRRSGMNAGGINSAI